MFFVFFPPGPPSAPVNAISSVNGTSVNLEWDLPLDTGGRSDLKYSVLCQKCSGDGGACEDCASSPGGAGIGKAGGGAGAGVGGMVERLGSAAVRFVPRQSGLTEPRVTVLNLVAHTNYSFRLLAMNAVTHLSMEPSPYALVNITTNQAGRVRSSAGFSSWRRTGLLWQQHFMQCASTARCATVVSTWETAPQQQIVRDHFPQQLKPSRLIMELR